MRYRVSVIGSVRLARGDGELVRLSPSRKETLAKLVAAGPHGVKPADFLGQEADEVENQRAKLRTAVSRLRAAGVPDDWVIADGSGGYRLTLGTPDVDVWELEALASGADLPDDEVLAQLLSPASPYPDVPDSLLIEEAVERARDAQTSVLNRLFDSRPASAERYANTLDELLARDPYDERLILMQAGVLARLGQQREALSVISSAHGRFAELGMTMSDAVRQVEGEILRGGHSVVSATQRLRFPSRLRSRLDTEWVGSRAPIDRLVDLLGQSDGDAVLALVAGVSGSGKSRVVAEAASVAYDRGWNVTLVSGGLLGADLAFAPFAAALKSADPEVAVDLLAIDDSQRLQQFDRLDRSFAQLSAGRNVLVVVDDAQGLDEASLSYLGSLIAAPPEGVAAVFVNGRAGMSSTEVAAWRRVESLARRAGAVTVQPPPLSMAQMVEFVSSRRPSLRLAVADRLAQALHEASAGLPGVAGPLLAALSDHDPSLNDDVARGAASPLTAMVGSLRSDLLLVGAALAVLDVDSRTDALVSVLRSAGVEVDGVELLDALNELVDRELVVRIGGHRYVAAHVLIRSAFTEAVEPSTVARLHAAAAEMSPGVHRRAHHLWNGVPIVAVPEAAHALSTSARELLRAGNTVMASERFELLSSVSGDELSIDDRAGWARALDLIGSHDRAESVRAPAYDMAARQQNWSGAFAVATSSLPEGERFDGDPFLATRLRQLSSVVLPPSDAWRYALDLTRQSGLTGDFDAMRVGLRRMRELADSPAERVQLGLTERLTANLSPAQTRLSILDWVEADVAEVDDALRAEYLINRCVDLWCAGRCRESRNSLLALRRVEEKSDRHVWLESLLSALMATEREEDSGADLRRRAFSLGNRAGLADADAALLAGEFVELWLVGQHALLAPALTTGEVDIEGLVLARAAAAAILWETGELGRSEELARSVMDRVAASPLTGGVPAVIWISGVLEALGDEELSAAALSPLLRQEDSMTIIGAGAAGLGPTARYAARLTRDSHQRRVLLEGAVATADRSGLDRWMRLTRADLAASSH